MMKQNCLLNQTDRLKHDLQTDLEAQTGWGFMEGRYRG